MVTTDLDSLVVNNQLITFVGTGGVGKTSLSFAVAIRAAELGRKVAAVTVDPSRRLSSLLGIDSAAAGASCFSHASFDVPIDIFYVEPQSTFVEFVSEHLSPELFTRLQNNGIFQQISKNLRETHNFAALYKMQKILKSGDYDLVILDTPPCHQVVDFLESPLRLQSFFASKPVTAKKGWKNWVQSQGLNVVESFVGKLVGQEFVDEMEGFFRSIGELRDAINEVSHGFTEALRADSSQLMLVFPPAQDKIEEARYLRSEIEKSEYRVDGYVLNRSHPINLDLSSEASLPQDSFEKSLYNYYMDQKARSESVLLSFKSHLQQQESFFALVPEIDQGIKTREDIIKFANQVTKHWKSV